MFERILVPLDGSPLAERILPCVERIGRLHASELLPFRAYATEVSGSFGPVIVNHGPEATEYVEEVARRLRGRNLRARGLARHGDAASTILEGAAEEGASLIAMSSHGRTGLARWILGSVAEKVVRAATIPVLMVRSFSETAEPAFKRILLPFDGSELAKCAVPHVLALARAFGSQVLLLRVLEQEEVREPAELELRNMVAKFSGDGIECAPLFRTGDPAAEILDAGAAHAADLLAMSTRGRTGSGRWIFGSVTEKVVRAGSLPMLVVPAKNKESKVLVRAAESCWKE